MPPGFSDAETPSTKATTVLSDEAGKHQLAGLQQRRQHHQHRLRVGAGEAEIALQRSHQPVPVAQQDRLIEAVDRAQMGDHLRRGAGVRGDHGSIGSPGIRPIRL